MDNSLLLGLLAKGGGGGSPEGSAIKSTGEAAGEVLMTDGAGGAVWTPDMTDTEIDLLFIEKGAILKMNLDGTERSYRVLKNVSGSVFEVLGMFAAANYVYYNQTSTTATFADGSTGQKYAGGSLDNFFTGWFNTLTSDAKAAIVDKNIVQDMWWGSNNGDPDYWGSYGGTSVYQVSLKAGATLAIGDRHVYALSIQDIIDYLEVTPQMTFQNTTLNDTNLKAFLGDVNATCWLRSANANFSGKACLVQSSQQLSYDDATDDKKAYPAFQIDLSKIEFSVE